MIDALYQHMERRRLAGWLGAVSAPGGGTPPGQPPGRRRSELELS